MIHGANCNCKECESALSHKIESSFKDAEFAKRFTELTGLELPENYNAADILNRMKKFCGGERYEKFVDYIGIECAWNIESFIPKFILNPPALLRKAVEYLEKKGE